MKHLLHFKTLFAMMLMLICVNGAWAQSTVKDVLTATNLGLRSGYNPFTSTGLLATYEGVAMKSNRGAIQLRTNNGGAGIVTTVSELNAISVTVDWNSETIHSRVLDIYGQNVPFKSKDDLFGKNTATKLGSISYSEAPNTFTITGDYKYIGLRSKDGAVYLNSVTIEWEQAGDPSKQDQMLSFGSTTTFEVVEGGTFTAPVLTGAKTPVTYESSNTAVATVDAHSGAVTLAGGVGTATITATAAENATYNAALASYTLTVKAAPKMVQNIAEFLAKKGTDAVYTFTHPVVVVKQYHSDLWIKDASGFLNVHGQLNQSYNLGDEIPAGFSGRYSEYKSVAPQLASPAGFQAASQTGLEVLPVEMKVADITNADINKYVVLKGVTLKGKTLVDGANSISFYDKFKIGETGLVDGNQYDVVAIVNYYNNLQVLPVSFTAADNNKKDQTLSFGAAEYSATMGEAFVAPTVAGAKTPVTYESNNTAVATVDAHSGAVTLVGDGKAVITATAEATAEYNGASASYVLNVAKGKVMGEVLPYLQNGAGSKDLSDNFANDGLDAKDYSNSSANLKFAKAGAKLTMKLAEAPATLSCMMRWNGSGTFGKFLVETSVDGKSYQVLKAYTSKEFATGNEDLGLYATLDENVRYIRWTYVEKVIGNVGLGSIFVAKKGDVTAYPVKMSAVKHATFFADEAVVLPAGLTANYATVNKSTVRLTPVYHEGEILPAKLPVVLTGEAADYELGKSIASASKEKGANDLRGALTDEVITAQAGEKFYILANDAVRGLGFYFQGKTGDGSSVHGLANKAYLVATGAAASIKGFAIEGEATGIEGVEVENADAAIYTLSGVRVNAEKGNLPKGIYIIGGKKVLVK